MTTRLCTPSRASTLTRSAKGAVPEPSACTTRPLEPRTRLLFVDGASRDPRGKKAGGGTKAKGTYSIKVRRLKRGAHKLTVVVTDPSGATATVTKKLVRC